MRAILYQNQDDVDHIIGYASRSLSKIKFKNLAHKLEFLALKWSIMEQFHKYLNSNNLVVYTENNPVTYVLNRAKLDAMGHHRAACLANYNFALSYQSGKKNVDADALSHIPRGSMISILKLIWSMP